MSELSQNLRVGGKRIIGQEEVFFVSLYQPVDKFKGTRQQLIPPVDDAVQVNQIGCIR
jgi:hypothetical protein